MATPELRPRSATEIIDVAFQLLRANYAPLVTLAAAAQIPTVIVRIGMARMGLPQMMAGMGRGGTVPTLSGFGGAMILELIIGGVIIGIYSMITQAALMSAASVAYLGGTPSPAAALRRGLSRFPTLLAALIILLVLYIVAGIAFAVLVPVVAGMHLPGVVGVVLFIAIGVAAIYYGIRLALLYPVIVAESHGAWDSLKRIWLLGEGSFGHMFLTLFLSGIIFLIAVIIIAIAGGLLGAIVKPLADPTLQAILQGIGAAFIYPLFMTAIVTLYFDLRIRKEGLDVEMMTKSLAD